MIKPERLRIGDTIGIIAPSRPVINNKEEINAGVKILEDRGFRVKLGKNLYKRSYYSAGTPKERFSDLNAMFKDKKIKAIICATGGITSNQLLDLIDYETIKKNPKIFLGYSDITTLLLSIYKKTGVVTFHGTDLCGLSKLNKKSKDFLFDMLMGEESQYTLPAEMIVLKEGRAKGKLLGGNLILSNSLLGTKHLPLYRGAIWFWEVLGESPASIDQKLHHFKLSGNLEKISAMIIGNLTGCKDKRHKEDNRLIEEIVLEITKEYNFPIIKVSYFGHDISSFYTFPIGVSSQIDTKSEGFKILESPVS